MKKIPLFLIVAALFGATSRCSAAVQERKASAERFASERQAPPPSALHIDVTGIDQLEERALTADADAQIAAIERLSAHLQTIYKHPADPEAHRSVAAIESIAAAGEPRVQAYALRQLQLADRFESAFDGPQTPLLALTRIAVKAAEPELRAFALKHLEESERRLASAHFAARRALDGDGPTLVDDADFARWGRYARVTEERWAAIRPAIEALTPPPVQVEPTWRVSSRAARWLPGRIVSSIERRRFDALIAELSRASKLENHLATALKREYDRAVEASQGKWARSIELGAFDSNTIDVDQSPVFRAYVRYASDQGFELSRPPRRYITPGRRSRLGAGYRVSLTPRVAASASSVGAAAAPSAAFEKAREALWRALDLGDYAKAVEAAREVVRLSPTEQDRIIYQTMLEQTEVQRDAKAAESARHFKEAIALYKRFAERWPAQAGPAIDRKDVLERYETLLPESEGLLPSGAQIAAEMIAKLPADPRDLPRERSPELAKLIVRFRQMMRPLTNLDLKPIAHPAPGDLARFRDFARAMIEAGRARSFARLGASFSTDDPSPGSGQPNSLLAYSLIAYTDRPTESAFGIHDLHE